MRKADSLVSMGAAFGFVVSRLDVKRTGSTYLRFHSSTCRFTLRVSTHPPTRLKSSFHIHPGHDDFETIKTLLTMYGTPA